jgi:hypothetical protein
LVIREQGDVEGHITGSEAMKKRLRIQPRPDAVFCFNDAAAVGAMEAILEAGLRIPADIALVGCGNLPYSGYLRVPLSSVDQGSLRLGQEAAKLSLALLNQKKIVRPRSILIPPQLVVRESTVVPVRSRQSQVLGQVDLTKPVTVFPDRMAGRLLGEAYAAKGSFAGGIKELESARDDDPLTSRIHWDLLRAYSAVGRSDDARREKEEIEKLNRASPESGPAQDERHLEPAPSK